MRCVTLIGSIGIAYVEHRIRKPLSRLGQFLLTLQCALFIGAIVSYSVFCGYYGRIQTSSLPLFDPFNVNQSTAFLAILSLAGALGLAAFGVSSNLHNPSHSDLEISLIEQQQHVNDIDNSQHRTWQFQSVRALVIIVLAASCLTLYIFGVSSSEDELTNGPCSSSASQFNLPIAKLCVPARHMLQSLLSTIIFVCVLGVACSFTEIDSIDSILSLKDDVQSMLVRAATRYEI